MHFPEVGNIDIAPQGSLLARIAIVGDFTSGFDRQARRPFSGYAGQILENCLHNAGLIRGEVYLTNLIKAHTDKKEQFYNETTGKFTPKGMDYVYLLQAEMSEQKANVIVAAGAASFSALCSLRKLSRYRGYVFPSTSLPGRKVIPIHHPSAAMRGMYTYRYLIANDLKKAKEECLFPELSRPERQLVYQHDTVADALDWLAYYEKQDIVGFDIEVLNFEVSCISFSSKSDLACVIPLVGKWTLEEEALLWRGIQKVLGNPNSVKVIQNSMFDIPFLLTRNGVTVRGPIHDTMIAHSIMFADLPKGLGFLGSIYCGAQEYWKDSVTFTNIKENS